LNKPIIIVATVLMVAGFFLTVYNESVLVPTVTDYGFVSNEVVKVYPFMIFGVILLIVGGVAGLIGYFVPEDRYYTEIEPTEKSTET